MVYLGKLVFLCSFNIAIEHGLFIVDLPIPIKDYDFPVCYVSLPKGMFIHLTSSDII